MRRTRGTLPTAILAALSGQYYLPPIQNVKNGDYEIPEQGLNQLTERCSGHPAARR